MRIERAASNTFTLAVRPTLSPSRWLLRFVAVDDETVYQLCIADAVAVAGRPVQLTFTEVGASPEPQDGEVTLSPGQWNLYVYEQDTTSLNWTQADRLVYEQLVEVVGAEAPLPEPTDPCAGGGGPCNPLSYSLSDSDGNVLLNGLESDPCGKQLDLIAPDATVTRDGQPFGTVPSGGTIDVPSDCPECDPELALRINGGRVVGTYPLDCGTNDFDVEVTRDDGTPIGTWDAVDERVEVLPGKVQLQDTAANDIGAPVDVEPESTGNIITAPDGTVNVRNSVPTLLIAQAVRSGATVSADVADSTITRPDSTTFGLPATQAFDIRTLRSGIVYQFGDILWSGQTTSFRTGDEADLWAAGWFNYNRPVYPLTYARLGADRLTLAENNIHGNTNRFTDQSGGQTYANDIVQDHLTGLEWYRVLQSSATWNDAIDGAVALNVGGNTDWRLPPSKVLDSIANDQAGSGGGALNYAPFSISNANYWTSSTYMPTTTSAFRMGSQQLVAIGKGGLNGAWIACRKFL